MRKILLSWRKKMVPVLLFAGLTLMPQWAVSQSAGFTFRMENATLKEIINEVRRISNYDFVYSDADIADVPRRTVNFNNAAISQVLTQILADTGLESQVDGNTIIIRRAATTRQGARTVTGRVTNTSGRPIVGATVMVKGTSAGVSTDLNGHYALTVQAGSHVLIFSCVGLESQEITVSAQAATLNVTMKESVMSIEEVVVTGMFTRARESYTGSVTQISKEELKQYRGQNLIRTIGNIDPSLNIALDNEYGSDPNRVPEITIRGNSSLPKSLKELNEGISAELNAPLIIMDGFPISIEKLMDFNDENVESINILKDASATAIYGSRGANGVIVIVTKRPTEGDLRIGLRVGVNVEIPDLNSYNLMNAREKLRLEEVAGLYNSPNGPVADRKLKELYYEKLADIERGVETYWLGKPLRTSIGQSYNLNIDFGSDRFQVGASLAYNNILGVMKGSERNTFSGTIDLQYEYKSLKFKNQTGIDINKSVQSPYGEFADYAKMNPYWRTHDEEGNVIPSYLKIAKTSTGGDDFVANPLYNATLNSIDQSKYTSIYNNFQIEWEITDGLRLVANLGLTNRQSTSDYFKPPSHTDFQKSAYVNNADNFFRKGTYTYETGDAFSYETNLRLDYTKTWNDKHLLVAGFNYSMSEDNSLNYIIKAEGFINDEVDFFPNALQFAEDSKPDGSESVSRRVGFTGNVNYTYYGRYYIDLSYRIDGSSIFGTDNKFAPFWSAGVGWNIHNEEFLAGNNTINRLKLRASIGETGSQQFAAYMAQQTFKYYSGQRYIQWSGAELMGLGNSKLKWQTTLQGNIGLETDLFKSRLNLMFEVYQKKTTDLLSSMDIPKANGFDSYTANVGEVENKGFEASVQGVAIRDADRDITLSITAKIAYNKNTIVKLSQAIKDQTALALQNDVNMDLLFEGHSIKSIYAVPSLGIDPSTGREIFMDQDGNLIMEGDWKAGYRRYFGVAEPKYRGNISTYFSYKNLSLNLSFAYHWGGQQYNSTLMNKVEVTKAELETNVDKRVYEQRWLSPGDVKFFKAFSNSLTRQSSRYVMDDNVFQLQSANLMYRWKADFLERAGIDLLNFSLNMSDVFYLSSIKRERGTSYPFSRKVSLMISLQF